MEGRLFIYVENVSAIFSCYRWYRFILLWLSLAVGVAFSLNHRIYWAIFLYKCLTSLKMHFCNSLFYGPEEYLCTLLSSLYS